MNAASGKQTEFDRAHGVASVVDAVHGSAGGRLFLHCCLSQPNSQSLAGVLVGAEKYAERALNLAQGDDVVCVKDPVDRDYLEWLAAIGPASDPDRIVVTDPGVIHPPDTLLARQVASSAAAVKAIQRSLGGRDPVYLDNYMFTAAEAELAGTLASALKREVRAAGGSVEAIADANRKHVARAKARELGTPVAPGRVVRLPAGPDGRPLEVGPLEAAVVEFLAVTSQVIIRGDEGASGSSLFVADRDEPSPRGFADAIRARTDNSVYLVEALLPTTVSPNVGMYINPDDGRISCVGVTDQILKDGVRYLGNRYPSQARNIDEMIASSRSLCEWLRNAGATGHIGFDFCETAAPAAGIPGYFLSEINPRVNGATYSRAIFEKVNAGLACPVGAYEATNVRPQARSFAELRAKFGEYFFSAARGCGVVPFNTGCLAYGRCAFVILGESSEHVHSLYRGLPPDALGPAGPKNRDMPPIHHF